MEIKTYDPPKGISIDEAAERAVDLAQKEFVEAVFEFNGIIIIASPFSHPPDLAKIYDLKHRLRPFLKLEGTQ